MQITLRQEVSILLSASVFVRSANIIPINLNTPLIQKKGDCMRVF